MIHRVQPRPQNPETTASGSGFTARGSTSYSQNPAPVIFAGHAWHCLSSPPAPDRYLNRQGNNVRSEKRTHSSRHEPCRLNPLSGSTVSLTRLEILLARSHTRCYAVACTGNPRTPRRFRDASTTTLSDF